MVGIRNVRLRVRVDELHIVDVIFVEAWIDLERISTQLKHEITQAEGG